MHLPHILKGYSAIGYKTKSETSDDCIPEIKYDGRSFYPIFSSDITNARSEILIVSPFMRKNRLTQMIKLLTPVIINGITVTVVTRPPEDFKESERLSVSQNADYLREYGIQVKYRSDFHQKFAVIDQKTVW